MLGPWTQVTDHSSMVCDLLWFVHVDSDLLLFLVGTNLIQVFENNFVQLKFCPLSGTRLRSHLLAKDLIWFQPFEWTIGCSLSILLWPGRNSMNGSLWKQKRRRIIFSTQGKTKAGVKSGALLSFNTLSSGLLYLDHSLTLLCSNLLHKFTLLLFLKRSLQGVVWRRRMEEVGLTIVSETSIWVMCELIARKKRRAHKRCGT